MRSENAGEAEKYRDGDYLVDEAHCPEVAPRFTDLAMSLPFKGLGTEAVTKEQAPLRLTTGKISVFSEQMIDGSTIPYIP